MPNFSKNIKHQLITYRKFNKCLPSPAINFHHYTGVAATESGLASRKPGFVGAKPPLALPK